jgi:hypothetical protein
LYEIIVQLKLISSDGKKHTTDCADTEGILRIIQSIPSPNAEPFKQWLAKVGYERIEETEDPEKAFDRAQFNKYYRNIFSCFMKKLENIKSPIDNLDI